MNRYEKIHNMSLEKFASWYIGIQIQTAQQLSECTKEQIEFNNKLLLTTDYVKNWLLEEID